MSELQTEAIQGSSDAFFTIKEVVAAKDINEVQKDHYLMQKSTRIYTEISPLLREIAGKQITKLLFTQQMN